MTKEEIQEFKKTIEKTIMPIVKNMQEKQIKEIIALVEREHPELPEGYGNMLYKQILIMKYNK
ncbi:hypothetical protein [Halarcobacter sp.]|uniref:hypothetical protein n=1 Tax=Halarcobacter sp. TaxID=2321133 RepID=UPI002AAAC3A9|nr:hypothetical protein [Halarcobacter sp.]